MSCFKMGTSGFLLKQLFVLIDKIVYAYGVQPDAFKYVNINQAN